MPTTKTKSKQKVERLLERLRGGRSLLIVMQDNPDPDSLAAAAALRKLANSLGDVNCSIAHGGVIGRGENRAMAAYLSLNFRKVDTVGRGGYHAVALLDTQPGTGNNSLAEDVLPDIVIDHHPLRPATRSVPFTDVRSKYGAVSTILFEYLREAGIKPDPPLATALLYAIRTDTKDLGVEAVQADVEAVEALYPLANTRMLSAIQRGAVDSNYFVCLSHALHSARIRGSCIVSGLGEVGAPDMVGEVADILLRHEDADWVLCHGIHEGKLWLSLRTAAPGGNAGETMRQIVEGIGTGGGHDTSAGGQVALDGDAGASALQRRIRERLLRLVGDDKSRAVRLVAP